jgi:hypothetical protein
MLILYLLAVFDNHRVLHGRSAFTGTRRLCGAYVSGDDYRSRLLGLEKQFSDPKDERSGYQLERKGVRDALERLLIEKADGQELGEGRKEVWKDYLS